MMRKGLLMTLEEGGRTIKIFIVSSNVRPLSRVFLLMVDPAVIRFEVSLWRLNALGAMKRLIFLHQLQNTAPAAECPFK